MCMGQRNAACCHPPPTRLNSTRILSPHSREHEPGGRTGADQRTQNARCTSISCVRGAHVHPSTHQTRRPWNRLGSSSSHDTPRARRTRQVRRVPLRNIPWVDICYALNTKLGCCGANDERKPSQAKPPRTGTKAQAHYTTRPARRRTAKKSRRMQGSSPPCRCCYSDSCSCPSHFSAHSQYSHSPPSPSLPALVLVLGLGFGFAGRAALFSLPALVLRGLGAGLIPVGATNVVPDGLVLVPLPFVV
ncbi:hypothetical protein C8R45DRAFT_1013928, partial [Mycena sanguinolenta]